MACQARSRTGIEQQHRQPGQFVVVEAVAGGITCRASRTAVAPAARTASVAVVGQVTELGQEPLAGGRSPGHRHRAGPVTGPICAARVAVGGGGDPANEQAAATALVVSRTGCPQVGSRRARGRGKTTSVRPPPAAPPSPQAALGGVAGGPPHQLGRGDVP